MPGRRAAAELRAGRVRIFRRRYMDEVFTVYKLIILYMLDRAEGDVTQAVLSSPSFFRFFYYSISLKVFTFLML